MTAAPIAVTAINHTQYEKDYNIYREHRIPKTGARSSSTVISLSRH